MTDQSCAQAIAASKTLSVAPPLYERWSKRAVDVVGSLALALVFLPLILVVIAAVQSTEGPVLFRHRRLGANGRPFYCLKFRTMRIDAEQALEAHLAQDPAAREEWKRDFKLRNDPRITAVGRFLRKTSLDELPQLLNVLRGEMSLVGPRPIIEPEITKYGARYEVYKQCRPGLTGLWQVSGRSSLRYEQRVELDSRYATEWSFRQDLVILAKTPITVLKTRDAL